MSGIVPHTPFAYPRSVCSSCFYLLGGCKVWVGLFQICTSSFLIAHQLLTRDFWSLALSLLFLVYQVCVSTCPHSLLSPIYIIAFCTDNILDQISFRKQTLSPSKYHYSLFSDLVLLVPASTDVLRT